MLTQTPSRLAALGLALAAAFALAAPPATAASAARHGPVAEEAAASAEPSQRRVLELSPEDLPELEPTPLMGQETRIVIDMLETMHFKSHPITSENFRKLIEHFMSDLDYNHLYFLQESVDQFERRYGDSIGRRLRHEGDLEPAFEIYRLYRERAVDRLGWAIERLGQDWSFDEDEALVYDRSEKPWPATEEEADALWTKRLKNEMLQELLNDKTVEEARERLVSRYERMLRDHEEFGSKEVQEIFLSSLMQMFDPHSTYFSSRTLEDFKIGMSLSLTGIGALLSEEDGYCVVKELIPGGPAKRGGELKPNDRIVAVAQGEDGKPEDIYGMGLRRIVDKIRGKKGTTVVLTVIPAEAHDESARKEIAIVRDTVRISSSRASAQLYQVPNGQGEKTIPIGVIDIPSFYGAEEMDDNGNRVVTSVTDDVEELVAKLRAAGAQAIALDMRRNSGGLLEEAIRMTGLFIRRGPVVQVKDQYGRIMPQINRNPRLAYTGPLAVLTSRFSASASEIVAGALQNYGRAIVIGDESTHGKGTVQQVMPLEDYVLRKYVSGDEAGAAKLTVRKFYLPNGFSTQRKGVVPDIPLPSVEQVMAKGEADLPNALPWDYIEPAGRFREMTLKNDFLNQLHEASRERQNSLEEFDFLMERIEWYRKRNERKEVTLNLETRKRMLEADESFMDRMKDTQRELAAALNFEYTPVKLDSVLANEEEEAAKSEHQAASGDDGNQEEASSEAFAAGDDRPASPFSLATDEGEAEGEEEEPVPEFDIRLRESLRILADAVEASPNPRDWLQPASPIANKARFEAMLRSQDGA